jgi:Ribosomal protein S17
MADEHEQQSAPASIITRASRKTRTGDVVSSGMNKTIVVRTVTRVPHPKFGKIVKQMKKFYATTNRTRQKLVTGSASWRPGR